MSGCQSCSGRLFHSIGPAWQNSGHQTGCVIPWPSTFDFQQTIQDGGQHPAYFSLHMRGCISTSSLKSDVAIVLLVVVVVVVVVVVIVVVVVVDRYTHWVVMVSYLCSNATLTSRTSQTQTSTNIKTLLLQMRTLNQITLRNVKVIDLYICSA